MDGKKLAGLLVAGVIALVPGLARIAPAAAAGSAPGAPGSNATWNESNVTGFADSLGAGSKVWYTLGNGELENAFYPQTDNPDTFGLQYVVTNGSSFASTETSGTSHTISLVDPQSLVWQQVNKANNGTDASGDTVYLDGNLSALGLGQPDWAANGIPMTRVSATKWTATVNAAAAATLSYKYDLGGNWSNVEKGGSCADIGNRSMSVSGGTVTDTVANWGGPSACGNSGAVISVTVPSNTPSGDTVYLSGNYDVLGTGIPAADDWVAADYPMTPTGTNTWSLTLTGVPVASFQYKFTLGSWNNVEETSSCGNVANRNFGFDTAGATYTASDTVAAWAGVGSC